MKITAILPHRLSLPRPVKTSRHDIRTIDTVCVEMRTDGGAVGSGYWSVTASSCSPIDRASAWP